MAEIHRYKKIKTLQIVTTETNVEAWYELLKIRNTLITFFNYQENNLKSNVMQD